jgi:hypothetical protein
MRRFGIAGIVSRIQAERKTLFLTKKNLAIQRAFNKGRSDIRVLFDLQTGQSFSFKNFPESFAAPAALLIKVKAAVQHAEDLAGIVNPRQFFSEPGMAPQLAADENAISLLAFTQRSGRADLHTLAAGQTARKINRGSPLFEGDRFFLAGVYARPAFRARLICDFGGARSNETHINDLGS